MSESSGIKVTSIDHIVLYVKSIEESVQFYSNILGMQHQVFTSPKNPDTKRHALIFGSQKINLHDQSQPWQPHATLPRAGTADLCFLTDTSVDDVLSILKERDIHVLEDGRVVSRTGAKGRLRSVYVRDPDGNLVEYACLLLQFEDLIRTRSLILLPGYLTMSKKFVFVMVRYNGNLLTDFRVEK